MKIHLITGVLTAAWLVTSSLRAAEAPAEVSGTAVPSGISDALNFEVGVTPNFDGNLILDSGFSYQYYGWLRSGFILNKSTRGLVEEKSNGDRKLTVISDQITRFEALGLKIPLADSGSFKWAIKPGIGGQYLFQETKLNLINRSQDRFAYEDSNLESLQISTDFETWMDFGNIGLYLGGSVTPVSSQKENGLGFDSVRVSVQDDFKNIIYQGSTGDYAFTTRTETFYYDAKARLRFRDLIMGNDVRLGFAVTSFSYDLTATESAIVNAQQVSKSKTDSLSRFEMTYSLGFEMGFINLGEGQPYATLSYTQSKFQDIEGKDVTDNVFGVGVLFRK